MVQTQYKQKCSSTEKEYLSNDSNLQSLKGLNRLTKSLK